MSEHANQIREAFQSHEHLVPDSVAVLARAQELARIYRRRRIGAQAAGGAVLGATLIAGGIGIPNLLGGGSRAAVRVQSPATGGTPATTPAATPVTLAPVTKAEARRDSNAYFDAGYGLEEAQKLARIWGLSTASADLDNVKVEAGRRLRAGETLPVAAAPANVADAQNARAVSMFFAAGYDLNDAERLSRLWRTADVYEAKVLAGEKLLAREELPIQP